ncbi:protein kinase domain-containing protein [Pyxidicoccus trucidator]|uniref:protein kinase domain-containing protein n=1 Tax=Pyxidicoccus trucidator TaxID=2709662 RepID=UPI0013D907EC|nr:protein kinase [Pyxidicoccus trucidator]
MKEPSFLGREDAVPAHTEDLSTTHDSDFHDTLLRRLSGEAPAGPQPLQGERLGGLDGGRYEVLALLGGGGMGQVFRALDHELRRTVALKFLLPDLKLAGPERLAFLRKEAQAVARLDHENIVRIHDVSEWAPRHAPDAPRIPFLVMEYLEGESLQSLLRRERPGLRRALDIVVDVAAGLAHAHERGLVHRDLKPANVFMLRGGRVKLLDFGLARMSTGPPAQGGLERAGTPPYMAPEQWTGGRVDARSDVWSAGVLLFQLLTGGLPLQERDTAALRARVTSLEPMPPLRERRPDLPEALDALVAAALAKDVEARPRSGAELLERLCALRERLTPDHPRATGVGLPGRRQVTLVSCRLSLSPDAGPRLDPEDSGELEAAFHHACAHIFGQHGGTVTTAVGAEVLACFGYPLAREDDAESAVRAALRLLEALPRQLADSGARGLELRVGIHSDLVALAEALPAQYGRGPTMQGEAPGVVVALAAQASPGTVLVSDPTRALVRGRFQMKSLGLRSFERLSGAPPLGIHQVLRECRGVSRFDRALVIGALTPLVGRERELRLLTSLLDAPPGEAGTFILLRGDAGIGKSRLVQELHDREPSGASTWAQCQCWPQYSHSAFHPLIDWLQRFAELATEDAPQRRRRKLEAWLEELGLPREHWNPLASLLSLPLDDAAPFLHLSPERQRARILEALAALLRHLAVRRPLVLVVEDLHWADPSTLQFLGALPGHLRGAPVRVLLTARACFQPDQAGRPGFHSLDVEPLSPEDTASLVREASRERALPEAMVARLVATTDGVPLFVEEVTRRVLELGGLDADSPGAPPLPIPATLNGLLLARLDQLPPRQKAQLQLAATLGREFSYELLRAVSFLSEDELLPELEQLERAGLLFRRGSPPYTTYAFKHALIQDAAYQCLLRGTRQRHHARVVQVLEEQFPEVVEEQPELLAQHATLAVMTARAVELWHRAGEQAVAKSALTEGIRHLTRALEQLQLLPASPERDLREVYLHGNLGQAFSYARGVTSEEVRVTYARALELCERLGETPLRVLWGIWNTAMIRGDPDADGLPARFHRLLEASSDVETRMMAHGTLCTWAFWQGKYSASRDHGHQMLALMHQQRTARHSLQLPTGGQDYVYEQLLYAHLYAALSQLHLGFARTARESYKVALAVAEAMRHPYALATALMFEATMAIDTYDLEGARDLSAHARALCLENGFPFVMADCTCLYGMAVAGLGNPEAGIATVREALALLRAMGARLIYPSCLTCLAQACLMGGRLDEAMAAAEEGLAEMVAMRTRHNMPVLYQLRGEIQLLRGDTQAARAAFEQSLGEARSLGAVLQEVRVSVRLGTLLRGTGDTSAARTVLEAACASAPPDEDLLDLQAAQGLLAELP